jgi:ppGpp synthetase/RelA/SpoT-type nucleotidyltranferase
MTRVIEFVKRYVREQDYYGKVAELCGRRLERILHDNSIRAITTWRAKRPDRLQRKLEEREKLRIETKRPPYETDEEIYEDIPDLAGARIALYFPTDRTKLKELISTHFVLLRDPKSFPIPIANLTEPEATRRNRKRFSGYSAEHFRVRLRDTDLGVDEKKYGDGRCEIQVASVLMHAWAEVEHDLEYKALSGSVSETESALLDQINGLVIAGEMALEQLQKATYRRNIDNESGPGNRGLQMRDQYDLANWLAAVAADLVRRGILAVQPQIGRADIAFRFLQLLDLISSSALSELRQQLLQSVSSAPESETPLAQMLIEMLLKQDRTREETLQQAKAELTAVEFASAPAAISSTPVEMLALGQFLTVWRRFEALLEKLRPPNTRGRFIPPTRIADEVFNLQPSERIELGSIRSLKNRAVHATSEAPSASQLFIAAQRLERLMRSLPERAKDPKDRKTIGDMLQSSLSAPSTKREIDALTSAGIATEFSAAIVARATKSILVIFSIENQSNSPVTISNIKLLIDSAEFQPTSPAYEDYSSDELALVKARSPLLIEPRSLLRGTLHFGPGFENGEPIEISPAIDKVHLELEVSGVGKCLFILDVARKR